MACDAALVYIDRADLSSKQALERLKELNEFPPMRPLADNTNLWKRMMCLETIQLLHRGADAPPFFFDKNVRLTPEDLKALQALDWVAAMQTLNKWCDRQTAALRLKDRAARDRELDKIEEELKASRRLELGDRDEFLKLLSTKEGRTAAGKKVGDALGGFMFLLSRKTHPTLDRSAQAERNLRIAFALAAYRADTGAYPKALADLAPKYLAAVPDDLFSGKPLIYKPTEKGYLFYSVGPNGKDDDGHGENSDPPGDDIGVAMPLPELKKK
jgi:hypothetical protein